MKRSCLATLLLALIAGSFLAGSWYNQRAAARNGASGSRKILYYLDPMHPAYKSDKPGIAPDCGMELVPVYEDGQAPEREGLASGMSPGTVQISPEKQQMIGIRVGLVEKTSGAHSLRILGRVAADETRIYRISAAVDGWIVEAHPNSVGGLVKKDEKLASFYSPEFLGAQQAFLFALGSLDRFQATGKETPEQIGLTRANIQQYKDSLRNLGMGELQIEEMARARQLVQNISITSPAAGFVLARNVSPGQRFEKGTELYRIADLSRVWILADVFENEAQYLRPGVMAQVSLPYQRKTFHARVSQVLPTFDGTTRTLKVRMEADNPGFVLRPDMFVDVELPISYSPTITVPVDALLDSGLKTTVFVDRGNGAFEPRKVQTGWRFGDRVQVVKGLMSGERIVISGTFLVDSESRMKAASAGIYGASSKDPICDMDVDESKARAAGRISEYRGQTYFFCSDGCKEQFDKNPERYVGKLAGEKGPHRSTGHGGLRP